MPKLVFAAYSALLVLSHVSDLCSAKEASHSQELKWREKLLKKHLPVFMDRETNEHILTSLRWQNNPRQDELARSVSNMFRDMEVLNQEEKLSLISRPCLTQITTVIANTSSGVPYALYWEDSIGRQPSGLLRGDYLWLGKYYECKGLTDENDIVAKGCLVILGEEEGSTDGLYVGTCYPESCTEEDVAIFTRITILFTSFATPFCREEKPFSSADIAAICVFSILAFFVLIGTVCETIFICMDLYYEEENPAHEARKRSVPAYLLLCFSLIKNTKTLLNTERKESTIPVLDGIRFLSMAWVILGHTAYFAIATLDNLLDLMNYYVTHFGAQVVVNGTFSVDSFFFLSGLLVTYLLLRQMRRSGSLNIPVMYLNRYLRLTPTLVVVMLFSVSLYMRAGEEPIYEVRNTVIAETCKEYWWTNMLYINNLYPKEMNNGCISWVWYLANDWQFFIISPFFIYLLYKHPKIGLGALGAVLAASIAITGALASKYDVYPDVLSYAVIARALLAFYKPRPPDTHMISDSSLGLWSNSFADNATDAPPATEDDEYKYFSDIYARPWCRIGAYVIGMVTGYILYATNKKIKMKLIFVIELWIAAFAVGLTLIYGWWGDVKAIDLNDFPSDDLAAFYEALKRPTWALCLSWLTIGCTIGYGGPINAILSWKAFMPLSRLTFCAYLVHPLILFYMFTARETEEHFRVNTYIYNYVAALVLSYSAAYVLSMLVEAPMGGLQKIIFYTPEGRKSWYAFCDINVKGRGIPAAQTASKKVANGLSKGTGMEMANSSEKSPPAYSSEEQETEKAFENCVDITDEVNTESLEQAEARTEL